MRLSESKDQSGEGIRPQGLRKYIPQRIHVYTSQKRTSERQQAQPAYDTSHELQRGRVDLAVGSELSKISQPK